MSAVVGVIMGSKSDWSTMKNAVEMLEEFGVPHEIKVVSAAKGTERLRITLNANHTQSQIEQLLMQIKYAL